MIESITENIYFSLNFTSKLIQRFPSITDIALRVFSFDNCVSVIDILLAHLENLSYIKIHYYQDTLLDDPSSPYYIIEQYRQIFPNKKLDEQKVIVKNNGRIVEIWLR